MVGPDNDPGMRENGGGDRESAREVNANRLAPVGYQRPAPSFSDPPGQASTSPKGR